MLLSHRVIKQVSEPMENWLVYPKNEFLPEEPEKDLPIEDYTREAEEILENARLEAASLLEEANRKILELERTTCEQAWQKGKQEAREAQEKLEAEFRASTRKILQETEKIRAGIYRDTEAELIELAVEIAEKLVCRQLELYPETVVDIAKSACSRVKECEMVIIYVGPDQLELVKARQDEIALQLYKTNRIRVIADPGIQSGGCRIETEQGSVDATIASMLKNLDEVLKE